MATTTVTARVSEDLAAALEVAAVVKKRTQTALVREAIEQWLLKNVSPDELLEEYERAAEERYQAELEHRKRLSEKVANGFQAAKRGSRDDDGD